MASKFFVGNGTNWSSTGSWALTTGGASGAAIPQAGDDVVLDGNSPGNLTIDASTNTIRSIVMTGFTHTVFHSAAVTLNIGGASAPASNIALVFAGTYTISNATTSAISIADTSAATNTYNFNGATLGAVTINNGTTTTTKLLTNGFNTGAAATVTLTQGGFNTNSLTCSWGGFNSANTNTRTLTLGSSSITLTSSAGFATQTTSGFTVTANTAIVSSAVSGQSINLGSLNYNGLSFVLTNIGSGTTIMGTGAVVTIGSLTVNGTVGSKIDAIAVRGNMTITGTLTLAGNTVTNRLFVKTDTVGTTRTLTAAAISISNVDFMDITGAGLAANAAWTGTSLGDCQGNSNITFDLPLTLYRVGVGGNWSASNWSLTSGGVTGQRVPLPQDTVNIDANASGTITSDMPRLSKDLTFTGFTGTWTNNVATGVTLFGNLTISSGMTWSAGSGGYTFAGRGSQTITSNGMSSNSITVLAPGGTYSLADNFTFASGGTVSVSRGTLDLNGHNLQCGVINSNGTTGARGITLGSGTLMLTGTGSIVNFTSAGLTLTNNTSTIIISDTSSTSKTIAGGGMTFGNINITGGGTGAVIFTGANTFSTFTIGAPKTVTFPSSTTTTVSSFIATGSSGNVITINSSTPTIQATLSKSSGIVSCDWLALTDSAATGGATWYAGANSTGATGQDNSGWIFTGVPSGGFFDFM